MNSSFQLPIDICKTCTNALEQITKRTNSLAGMTSNTLKSAQYPSIIFPFDMAVDTVLSDLLFSLRITSPIFVIIGLGYLLKKIGWINSSFAQMGSTLVFRVTLPCMLFVKLSRIDFTHGLPLTLVAYGATATIVIFLIDRIIAYYYYIINF